jgi:type I restriction-modification system DNA methylase subunit
VWDVVAYQVKDRLLLLHNLKDIEKVEDVHKVIEEDIKGAFNATEGDNDGTYYTSQHFYHFIVRHTTHDTRHRSSKRCDDVRCGVWRLVVVGRWRDRARRPGSTTISAPSTS